MSLKAIPARHLPETYPLHVQTRVLFSDMDAFRHVNNGSTGRYLEEGRADLNMRVFGADCFTNPKGGLQLLFATVTIDYLIPADYPGEVEVRTGIARFGNSSYVQAQAGFQNGVCFALGEAVMVKAIDGRPAPLSPAERAVIESLALRA